MSLSRETGPLRAAEEALAAIGHVVEAGSVWRHRRSRQHYRVAGLCLSEARLTPCVLYRHVEGGVTWSRPAKEFLDGRFHLTGQGSGGRADGR